MQITAHDCNVVHGRKGFIAAQLSGIETSIYVWVVSATIATTTKPTIYLQISNNHQV